MNDFRDLTDDERAAMRIGHVNTGDVVDCLCGDVGFDSISAEFVTTCQVCGRQYRIAIQVKEPNRG